MILTIVERVLIKQGTRKSWECSHINWLDMRKSKWDYLYNNGGIMGLVVVEWCFAYCTANLHVFTQDIMDYAR